MRELMTTNFLCIRELRVGHLPRFPLAILDLHVLLEHLLLVVVALSLPITSLSLNGSYVHLPLRPPRSAQHCRVKPDISPCASAPSGWKYSTFMTKVPFSSTNGILPPVFSFRM